MRNYIRRIQPHERQDAERMWLQHSAIWRCLATYPEGLRCADVAKLTGLTYNVAYNALCGTKKITGDTLPMSGIRREGMLFFAEGVTDEWIEVLCAE